MNTTTGDLPKTLLHREPNALKHEPRRKVIDHAERYVKGLVHTKGMEHFWSLLKRSIKGTYVSVEPIHLSIPLRGRTKFPIQ